MIIQLIGCGILSSRYDISNGCCEYKVFFIGGVGIMNQVFCQKGEG